MALVRSKYEFTNHAKFKMRHYGMTESRVQRIIRYPDRTEEAVLGGAVAAMQKTGNKKDKEMWVMYIVQKSKIKKQKAKLKKTGRAEIASFTLPEKRIRIITAWRYPGKSSARNPVPQEIINEIKNIIVS